MKIKTNDISVYKVLNVLILLLIPLLVWRLNIYWQDVCVDGGCTYEFMELFLRPLYWGSLALIPTFTLLLFFPARIFKYWLIGIFSWTFPLAIYAISQVNPYSSSVLSTQAGQLAWFLGEILYLVTILYLFFVHAYLFVKKTINKKSLFTLLVLIPAVVLWYLIFRY